MIYHKCERKRRREEARASPNGTNRESYHYEEGRKNCHRNVQKGGKEMSRTTGHRIFTLLLAIAVIFTYMPFSNLLGYDNTAFAASYSGALKQSDTGNKL